MADADVDRAHDGLASVGDLLTKIHSAADQQDSLTLGRVMDEVGDRSFASLLLVIGLVMLVPGPADIPGIPILLGGVVILLSMQMLLQRDHVWIPDWMERRRLTADRVKSMIHWLRRPARCIDRVAAHRWDWMVNRATVAVLAIASMLIAMSTPLLEFIPFSVNLAGGAIAAFGLSILVRDGLLAAVTIVVSLVILGWIAAQLMS